MRLQKEFFSRSTITVSKELLGKILVRSTPLGIISGRIVETEAYLGFSDPGCHAFRGKTPRNTLMFGDAGYYYVYFIYGMYFCLNIVTESAGLPEAVLIRATMPLEGIELMQAARKQTAVVNLASGPGKLTVAFRVDKSFNGRSVNDEELYLLDDGYNIYPEDIVQTARIGLKCGADLPLRFYPASLVNYVSKTE